MKQSLKQGEKNKIGAFGEEITVNYLKRKKFRILTTNYLKKWGEIDIVAHETIGNNEMIRFVEVKTVSYETRESLQRALKTRTWRPEENVTREKMQKLSRVVDSWLRENNKIECCWQIDVAAVRMVPHEKYATIKYLENVIL